MLGNTIECYKMAKICFITLYDKGCLGARYLSSILKREGHNVSIIYLGSHEGKIKSKRDTFTNNKDLWISVNEYGADIIRSYSEPISKKDIAILLDLLIKQRPDLIGFSLRTMFFDTAIGLTEAIRSKIKTPIIYGGIAATSEPDRCIRYADMVCIGEGEYGILELAGLLDRESSVRNAGNMLIRQNSTVYKNTLLPLEQDLDKIPFPDYDPENKFSILNSRLIENDKSIGNMSNFVYEIISSRGCPFACSYCCNDLLKRLYPGQRYLRRRSVKNVIEELAEVKKKYNIKSVLFKDEIFTFDINWIKEFVVAYKKDINLPFWCYTHPSFIDEEVLKLLKDAGMFNVTMGIQSGSENILFNIFNRRTPYKKIIQAAFVLDNLKLPIKPRYDIITNNPFESEDDCRKTLELLMDMPAPINFGLTKLSFIPGSKITEMLNNNTLDNKVDDKRYKFWNTLYLLRQYRFFPKRLINLLSRSIFFRRNPHILQLFLFPKFLIFKYQDICIKMKKTLPVGVIIFLKNIRYKIKGY